MQERVAAEPAETPEPATAPAAAQGAAVPRQVLALQRSAGNAAVNRLIARQELNWDPSLLPPDISSPPMRPIQFVFILGAKDDEALATAKEYYRSALMTSPFRKVISEEDLGGAPTLADVFEYLAQIEYEIAEITLVVHGNAEGELIVPLNKEDKDERTSPAELSKALDAKVLKPLDKGQITEKTRIRLQACFSGHGAGGHRMINLLDSAFGRGEGTVIAPTVEVAYAKDIWHSEGLSGWWVKSETPLTTDELAAALKLKYAKAVGELDLSTYQEDTGDHHVGERMQSEDEKWMEIARTATEDSGTGSDGVMRWVYVSAAFMQGVKPGYEDDRVLYTKSAYGYRPKEL
jgi:hypothetical protein